MSILFEERKQKEEQPEEHGFSFLFQQSKEPLRKAAFTDREKKERIEGEPEVQVDHQNKKI